eukprot:CAMPEP_0181077304 /NCGR_PEP_ID=MMETSP1071-20121207/881_1 /TAXON_ID=35127 /ORGANISM="Thalassiosira sp., Strain NH16" /LENGTH=691 /DNA_ID=CAMNT_0023158543 /DNA_START=343 /DNA_END=2418 /DNA_ORIENTATION=+
MTVQSTLPTADDGKGKGNSRIASPTRPPPPGILVRVMGSDGKSEAAIPIWIPLSIMASSSAKNAGQSEEISQVVANAVIDYGNTITQDYYNSGGPIDIMAEITTLSRKASLALIMAGGSTYAANAVAKAIKGGGVLLASSLNSKQVIRLAGSESRNDMDKTNMRNQSDPPRTQNGGERGVHHVGTADDDISDKTSLAGGSKKQVSWLETARVKTYTTSDTGGNPLSGKEIHFDSSRKKLRQGEKFSGRPQACQPSLSTSTDSSSEYTNSVGCAMVDVTEELHGQTFRPLNLLPQWEAQTVSDSVSRHTGRSERSMFDPLMNLFLPIPEEQVEPNKNKSRIVGDAVTSVIATDEDNMSQPVAGDGCLAMNVHWPGSEGGGSADRSNSRFEKYSEKSINSIEESVVEASAAASYTSTYNGTLHDEDITQGDSAVHTMVSNGKSKASQEASVTDDTIASYQSKVSRGVEFADDKTYGSRTYGTGFVTSDTRFDDNDTRTHNASLSNNGTYDCLAYETKGLHGAVTCSGKKIMGTSDTFCQSEALSADGLVYLDNTFRPINTNQDRQHTKIMSGGMSYNSALQGTASTGSILMAMQSINGGCCGVKYNLCPDENAIQGNPTETKSVANFEPKLSLAENPYASVEDFEVTPAAIPAPAAVIDKRKESTIQKIVRSFGSLGRLNCACSTKKKELASC